MERSGSNHMGFDILPKSTTNMILASLSKDRVTHAIDISPKGGKVFDARIALKHAMDSAGIYNDNLSATQAKMISSGIC